ncbi:MAG: hypothetical protein PWQ51_1254 [Methanolobus sp.]|jgi:hypothetical protein|uniref:hypothetical protein n=1 Tax=Methanolobus sp. TaxID=1874737 RepID=UPI00258D0CF1|nr:hypothetical protein [Methanolobus sp.]MDK2831773.1 hypothetical protein [Methanolobus sp.]MDK2939090.1 hypothetical protein [Methanolobus sp.]
MVDGIDAGNGLLFFGGIIVGGAFGIAGSQLVSLKYMIKDAKKPDYMDEDYSSYVESLESEFNNTKNAVVVLLLFAVLFFILMVLIIEASGTP